MARTILTAVLIVLLNVLVGCTSVDSGKSQVAPAHHASAPVISITDADETVLIEQMALNRQAYRQGLELLVKYYTKVGNNMKLQWAQKELTGLDSVIQYNYIVEAETKASLKADTSISGADALYDEALQIEKKAATLFLKDKQMLRLALTKYNQLIEKHGSSDKIDDAAYRAAGIYEHFKDYTLAVMYYKRVYQWDRYTVHPAKYRAAKILDKRLHERTEALELYRQVIGDEAVPMNYREYAERRIKELTKGEEGIE
ncbi:MAG: tetratricopeptide repeat protein [Planctomycetota bacterium]|jgi:tetratricopeptide (TPR) repeat protein